MGLLFTAATWGSLAPGSRVRAGRPRWWHIRVLVRKEASLLEDRARLLGSSAAGDDVVAGCGQRPRGRKVTAAPGGGVPDETEDRAPSRTDQKAAYDQPDPGRAPGEQPDEKADEEAEPGTACRARGRSAGVGEPPCHPLHKAQTGADDVEVLDRKPLVGEPVDRRLCLLVGGVAGHGVPGHADRVEPRRIEVSHGPAPHYQAAGQRHTVRVALLPSSARSAERNAGLPRESVPRAPRR